MADVKRLPFLFCAFCLLSGIVLLFIEHHHKPGDSGKRANQCKRKIADAVKQLPIDFFLCEAQKNSKQNQCNALLNEGKTPEYVCKYCLLCVGETLVRMANNALTERPGLPVVFAGGVMSSDLIRTYVTNRVPNAHFVPGKFASDNAIGISILAARECGAWPTTSM